LILAAASVVEGTGAGLGENGREQGPVWGQGMWVHLDQFNLVFVNKWCDAAVLEGKDIPLHHIGCACRARHDPRGGGETTERERERIFSVGSRQQK